MGFFDNESLDLGPWFTARFGECAECFAELEGEQARYKDGDVVCADCGQDDEVPAKAPVVCTSCFVTLSLAEQRAGRTAHEDC